LPPRFENPGHPAVYIFQIGRSYFHVSHCNGISTINAEFWNNNGILSLRIKNSRYTLNTNVWDINYTRGNKVKNTPGVLTFKKGPGETFLNVEFDANNSSISVYGQFWPLEGCCLAVQKNGIYADKTLLASKCCVQGANMAFWVRDDTPFYSAIGPIYGTHNVINVENCGILNATVGFVWDIAFL